MNKTGTITCKAFSDGLTEGSIDIAVTHMTAPVVPQIDNSVSITPIPGTNLAYKKNLQHRIVSKVVIEHTPLMIIA